MMVYYFAVSFALGIIFEKYFGFGWSAGALVVMVSAVLLFALKEDRPLELEHLEGDPQRQKARKMILIIGLALAAGLLRMSFVDVSPDQNLFRLLGQKVSLEALIVDEPDMRDASIRYTAKPDGSKSLVLLVADRFPRFEYGDRIKVSGKLDLPKNFVTSREALAKWDNNSNVTFDYINYLAKDKIHFLIYRPQIEKVRDGEGNTAVSFLYSIKNVFISKISDIVPEPNSSLLAGMIFGTKQSLGQGLLDDFKKAGLIHIVVLSGYNITVIAAGVFSFFSLFGKRSLSFILTAAAVVSFAVMVGLGATVIRALIMSLIAILARFLGRPADACRWLFIAGILMLLWNPLIIFYDPSFQLSFMATLGLILLSSPIEKFISVSRLGKLITPKFKVREIVSSTLAVQFFVLPLLIRMSGFVSVISFFVNPLVVPFVPLTMSLGALTGGLGLIPFIGKSLSWPLGTIAYIVSQLIISTVRFSVSLPLSTLSVGTLPLSIVFIWYLAYGFAYWKSESLSRSAVSSSH